MFNRSRQLSFDKSLRNPLFLQRYPAYLSVQNFFKEFSGKNLNIYDFGCGSKPYKTVIDSVNYIGLDLDCNNTEADVICDVTDTQLPAMTADIVCSFYLLEHVLCPADVLTEKYRLLKNGGLLYMLVPLYWEEHEQPFDYWRFTRYSIIRMLQSIGFDSISINPVNGPWSIIGLNLISFLAKIKLFSFFAIPLLNILFYFLDCHHLSLHGATETNVMTFQVTAKKFK